jgi:hypothetical protein
MRAWTIVVFILAFQASLAMLNMANPLNTGMGIVVDTTNKYTITPVPGNNTMELPQPQGGIYTSTGTANNPSYTTNPGGFNPKSFSSGYIENILGLGGAVGGFFEIFFNVIFSIEVTFTPYIGIYASYIQYMVLFILGIGLFQIYSGRSLKTAE